MTELHSKPAFPLPLAPGIKTRLRKSGNNVRTLLGKQPRNEECPPGAGSKRLSQLEQRAAIQVGKHDIVGAEIRRQSAACKGQFRPETVSRGVLARAVDGISIVVDTECPRSTKTKGHHRQEPASGAHVQYRLASLYIVFKPFQQHPGGGVVAGPKGLFRVEHDLDFAGSDRHLLPTRPNDEPFTDPQRCDGLCPLTVPVLTGQRLHDDVRFGHARFQ